MRTTELGSQPGHSRRDRDSWGLSHAFGAEPTARHFHTLLVMEGNFRQVANVPPVLCTTANDPPHQVFPKEKPCGRSGMWDFGRLGQSCPDLVPVFLVMQRKQQGTTTIILKL